MRDDILMQDLYISTVTRDGKRKFAVTEIKETVVSEHDEYRDAILARKKLRDDSN